MRRPCENRRPNVGRETDSIVCASVGWQSNDMAGQAERAPGENGIKNKQKTIDLEVEIEVERNVRSRP